MRILILGAAGQIAQLVEKNLLSETDHELVLYARNAAGRLKLLDPSRETTVDGDFADRGTMTEAMQDVDVVYLNDMGNPKAIQMILEVMREAGAKKIIGATVLGIYDEVAGAFGKWNDRMIGGSPRMQDQKAAAELIENSGLDYTLLRLTWLYNDRGKEAYAYTVKGEPFVGAEVSRQAVTRLISDIIESTDGTFKNQSLGVYEPGTENDSKPSFY